MHTMMQLNQNTSLVPNLCKHSQPYVVFQAFVEPHFFQIQRKKLGYMFQTTFVEPLKRLRRTLGARSNPG